MCSQDDTFLIGVVDLGVFKRNSKISGLNRCFFILRWTQKFVFPQVFFFSGHQIFSSVFNKSCGFCFEIFFQISFGWNGFKTASECTAASVCADRFVRCVTMATTLAETFFLGRCADASVYGRYETQTPSSHRSAFIFLFPRWSGNAWRSAPSLLPEKHPLIYFFINGCFHDAVCSPSARGAAFHWLTAPSWSLRLVSGSASGWRV